MSDAAVATGPSAGALIRQAREAAGLHVATLAASLKVPMRKLEALEEDRYDQLTDAVFARALASSVCRTLKVDPQPILDRLPQTSAPRLVPDHEAIGAPFRAPGDAAPPGVLEYLKRPVTLAVLGLLVGAVVILLLPSFRSGEAPAAARPEATEVPMAAPVVVSAGTANEPGMVTEQVALPTPAVTSTPASQSAAVAVAPSAATAQVVANARPAAEPASAPAANNKPPVAPTSGIVVFKATGQAWVEVTDSQGKIALSRLLQAGETAGASGALPLAVVVGSVSTTSVEVRGKPFDLARVSRDNVARFEIK